ncbi:MAG: hypothetical protein NC485_08435 [Ruminococcus flavefaciens]|nr:hypothetical protein [Ruminococcus flavefaciens]MCM1061817.1 hypothetical protein [Eubacterium sp.]
MQVIVSERECLDVAHLMKLTAERQDIPLPYGMLMKRGASLLIQLSAMCTMLSALTNNTKTMEVMKNE